MESRIGIGTQGEVYRIRIDSKELALKWYFSEMGTQNQYRAIQRLIQRGTPGPGFLWPIDIALTPEMPNGFGYVMALREPRFREVQDLFFPKGHRRYAQAGVRELIGIASDLAENFKLLHGKGLCYRDVNDRNVFFDANTRKVLICDCDNVGVASDDAEASQVLGTLQFMAPELVRGEGLHSTNTDLASLAILLFYLFFRGHPFDGALEQAIRCKDFDSMRELYGGKAPYIFDPENASNRPVPGIHAAAALEGFYPEPITKSFAHAFIEGWRNPVARMREGEWRRALDQALDLVDECQGCGVTRFYGFGSAVGHCDIANCGHPKPPVLFMQVGARRVLLRSGNRIHTHHLQGGGALPEYSSRVAQVVVHPSDPERVGLLNESGEAWEVVWGGGVRQIPPGGVLRARVDCEVRFNEHCSGRIVGP